MIWKRSTAGTTRHGPVIPASKSTSIWTRGQCFSKDYSPQVLPCFTVGSHLWVIIPPVRFPVRGHKLDVVSMSKTTVFGKLIAPAYYLPTSQYHSTIGARLCRREDTEDGGIGFNPDA